MLKLLAANNKLFSIACNTKTLVDELIKLIFKGKSECKE